MLFWLLHQFLACSMVAGSEKHLLTANVKLHSQDLPSGAPSVLKPGGGSCVPYATSNCSPIALCPIINLQFGLLNCHSHLRQQVMNHLSLSAQDLPFSMISSRFVGSLLNLKPSAPRSDYFRCREWRSLGQNPFTVSTMTASRTKSLS